MRVTFTSMFRNGLHDIQRTAQDLERAQREVSSLRRVQSPSDDPWAASAAVGERSTIRATDRYLEATDSAESRLLVIDSALSDVITHLTTAQSTVAAARRSFTTPQQREAYALQLEGLRDAVLGDLNLQYRGTFVFSGTAATTAPYAKDASGAVQPYAGDAGRMVIDVDRTRSVGVTIDGSRLVQGSEPVDLFAAFAELIDAVRGGDLSGMEAGMARLDRAFERATGLQNGVGNDLAAIEGTRLRLGDMRRASDARRSKLEDADLADAITRMQQADAAHSAAIRAMASTSRLTLLDFLK